ncbi:MAG: metallophosphoesterase [Thermoanaerobaculia bacterium]|nr:metallophosphoesterase [Thermoanaerobaculia bacterium]
MLGVWLHPLLPGGWGTVLAVSPLGTLPVWTLLRGLGGHSYPSATTRILVLRPFWYAMLFLPLLALSTLAGALAGLPFGRHGSGGRWGLALSATLFLVAALLGYAGSRRLVVKRLKILLPRLPLAFDGMRMAQVSDLHVGPHTSTRFLARIAAQVQSEGVDLIAVTGDQVDDFAEDVAWYVASLGRLEAPLGIFAIAGNHDVYAGWPAVHRGLTAAGLEVLVNEARPIERDGQRLWIAGTGDPAGAGWSGDQRSPVAPDIERTLASVPADEPVIVLAHNPALWPALAARGVDLTLSGHTHYGQLAIPRLRWSAASPFLRLAMGRHREGRSLLYINPGTNYWGIPFRIGTPPEITVLTLRATPEGEADIQESGETAIKQVLS